MLALYAVSISTLPEASLHTPTVLPQQGTQSHMNMLLTLATWAEGGLQYTPRSVSGHWAILVRKNCTVSEWGNMHDM